MMMSTMIVRLENLSVNQICKIFDRLLSPLIRHYKDKRPPPASG
nr:MAG TPA: NADH dehydrogenase [Caudoviricetes sp.]